MTNSSCDPMIKRVVEAILFISEKPVAIGNLKEVIDTATAADIRQAVEELKRDYEQEHRGMIITEIAGGYQMLSSPPLAAYVRNFFKRHVKEKLSRPALETLAIIAYKQPVTRGEIELIRGVNSDGVVGLLLNKALIKTVGRKDIPGRPYLYGTTKLFLEYFGLKSLEDLPRLESFPALLEKQEESVALHNHEPVPDRSEAAQSEPSDSETKQNELPVSDQFVSEDDAEGSAPAVVQETSGQTAEIPPEPEHLPREMETAEPQTGDENEDTKIEDAVELKQAMDEINRGGHSSEPDQEIDVSSSQRDL